ncbi:MAG: hypothetical protein ACQESE_02080 [Nanobdellota archaeon]
MGIKLFEQSRHKGRKTKAQAALEYMTTYGWAFMVIIASVGVLSHFGFLSPSKYIPESCEFGEQLQCEDHYFDTDYEMKFRFRNNFEAPINVTDVNITNEEDATIENFGSTVIPQGEIRRVEFYVENIEADPYKKSNFKMTFTFNRVGSSVEHKVSGTLYTKVTEKELLD